MSVEVGRGRLRARVGHLGIGADDLNLLFDQVVARIDVCGNEEQKVERGRQVFPSFLLYVPNGYPIKDQPELSA